MNFEFIVECLQSFNQLKKEQNDDLIMNSSNWNLLLELTCDAFDYASIVVLGQRVDKQPSVIYYASRILNDAQFNYCH